MRSDSEVLFIIHVEIILGSFLPMGCYCRMIQASKFPLEIKTVSSLSRYFHVDQQASMCKSTLPNGPMPKPKGYHVVLISDKKTPSKQCSPDKISTNVSSVILVYLPHDLCSGLNSHFTSVMMSGCPVPTASSVSATPP